MKSVCGGEGGAVYQWGEQKDKHDIVTCILWLMLWQGPTYPNSSSPSACETTGCGPL